MTSRPLILASASPRRKQLLEDAGLNVVVEPMNVKELYTPELDPDKLAMHNAELKARAGAEHITASEVVIGADTIVALNGKVYGKPISRDDAKETLQALSGKTHQVITGVCLVTTDNELTFADTTEVTFYHLTEEDIDKYIDSFKPFDKAGAYAIQEWIGLVGVQSIQGSYENVVGLPVARVIQELSKL